MRPWGDSILIWYLMANRDLRGTIAGACDAPPEYHADVQSMLSEQQRRSKEDIERSVVPALEPTIPPDRVLWHTHTCGELLSPKQDIMAVVRAFARSS
jgi:hypothetical protein